MTWMVCGVQDKGLSLVCGNGLGNEDTTSSAHKQDKVAVAEERTAWMQVVVVGR